jgi:hypothetical protein
MRPVIRRFPARPPAPGSFWVWTARAVPRPQIVAVLAHVTGLAVHVRSTARAGPACGVRLSACAPRQVKQQTAAKIQWCLRASHDRSFRWGRR